MTLPSHNCRNFPPVSGGGKNIKGSVLSPCLRLRIPANSRNPYGRTTYEISLCCQLQQHGYVIKPFPRANPHFALVYKLLVRQSPGNIFGYGRIRLAWIARMQAKVGRSKECEGYSALRHAMLTMTYHMRGKREYNVQHSASNEA